MDFVDQILEQSEHRDRAQRRFERVRYFDGFDNSKSIEVDQKGGGKKR